jgi:hypothetical protein
MKCDFDITNMTYEEYLVEFGNRAQVAYNRSRGRGYQGRNFDPNYRGLIIIIMIIIIININIIIM